VPSTDPAVDEHGATVLFLHGDGTSRTGGGEGDATMPSNALHEPYCGFTTTCDELVIRVNSAVS